VFGIDRGEGEAIVQDFVDQFGITFPILWDPVESYVVYTDYLIQGCATPFPRDFIIDQDGVVAYLSCEYDPAAMSGVIDSLLALADVEVPASPASDLTVGACRPNPIERAGTIPFSLRAPTHARLTVLDAAGRKVRILLDRTLAAGSHRAAWDGRDASGRLVAPGVYYYELSGGGRRGAGRVVVRR
jgi:hypothetical protein